VPRSFSDEQSEIMNLNLSAEQQARFVNRLRRQQALLAACAAGGKAIDYTTGRVRVVTLAELERRFDLQDNQVPVGQE
jgi:hypothetical protein